MLLCFAEGRRFTIIAARLEDVAAKVYLVAEVARTTEIRDTQCEPS